MKAQKYKTIPYYQYRIELNEDSIWMSFIAIIFLLLTHKMYGLMLIINPNACFPYPYSSIYFIFQ